MRYLIEGIRLWMNTLNASASNMLQSNHTTPLTQRCYTLHPRVDSSTDCKRHSSQHIALWLGTSSMPSHYKWPLQLSLLRCRFPERLKWVRMDSNPVTYINNVPSSLQTHNATIGTLVLIFFLLFFLIFFHRSFLIKVGVE